MPISPKQSQLGQKPQGQSPGQTKPGSGQNTELPEKTPPPNQEPQKPQEKKKDQGHNVRVRYLTG